MPSYDVFIEKFYFYVADGGTTAFDPLLWLLLTLPRKAFSLIRLETLLLRAPIVPLEHL